jgi:hypothetical protein
VAAPPTTVATPLEEATPKVIPTRVDIGVKIVDPDQWLFVEEVRGDARGGWATGTFDQERNRLTINTHDVARFAVHVEQLNINWERLVVIRMDGVNTELRKRDFAVYHFVLDEYGRWNVLPS